MEKQLSIAWLSLGENCLPDDILKRHARKSFSTPYSSGRSNIDYAIALEEKSYAELIEPKNLVYGDAWGTRVVRSSTITSSENIFDVGCSKGFEFTHHDPISSNIDRESILRKVSRLQEIRGKQDIIFLYHHRINTNTDINRIRNKVHAFQRFYTNDQVKCYVGFFYQKIVTNPSERRIETHFINDTLFEFIFFTESVWGGNDPDIFWARRDDDLIKEMIDHLEKLVLSDQLHRSSNNTRS